MKFKIIKKGCSEELKSKISKTWQIKEYRILKEIKKITSISIKTSKITCYLDSSTTNAFYGNKRITLGIKDITNDDILMVIAHELFHVFYWRKIKKMKLTKSSPGKGSKDEWKLAEVSAFLITNEKSLRKYWPSAQVGLYPETKEIYKKVKKFWKVGDFDNFISKSYKLLI